MTADERLALVGVKIERAKKHIADLNTAIVRSSPSLGSKDTGRNKCADCCGNRIAYLKQFRKDRFSYSAKCPKCPS